MTEDMTIIAEEAYLAAKEILEKARLEQGELFVVGCSTSDSGKRGCGKIWLSHGKCGTSA